MYDYRKIKPDKWIRQKGYEAQKAGIPKSDNPERDHEIPEYSDKRPMCVPSMSPVEN